MFCRSGSAMLAELGREPEGAPLPSAVMTARSPFGAEDTLVGRESDPNLAQPALDAADEPRLRHGYRAAREPGGRPG